MSIASSLARKDEILILETNKEKIQRINSGKSSIDDPDIYAFCNEHDLTIKAIEKKFHIIKNSKKLLEFGAAPGGWSQVALEINPKIEIINPKKI